MKVTVTGAAGMLGSDLLKLLPAAGYEPAGADIEDFDITDLESVKGYFSAVRPDAVIHCAAMTNVDACELDPLAAYRVNAVGSLNLALACRQQAIPIMLLSTDYVFDGEKREPYIEQDRPCPVSSYGFSKAAAEDLVARNCPDHKIVRTSWLFGKNGRNFIYAILERASSGETLQVVDDQRGAPTYTEDLAGKLVELLSVPFSGIFHVTGGEVCTWYEFAQNILTRAGLEARVERIQSGQLNRPAKRPRNSVMRNMALDGLGIGLIEGYRHGLDEVVGAYYERKG